LVKQSELSLVWRAKQTSQRCTKVIACAGGANINEYMMQLEVTFAVPFLFPNATFADAETKAVFLSRRLSRISELVLRREARSWDDRWQFALAKKSREA
jgi:hypothetical protein